MTEIITIKLTAEKACEPLLWYLQIYFNEYQFEYNNLPNFSGKVLFCNIPEKMAKDVRSKADAFIAGWNAKTIRDF